jgi:hypothetical protein
MKKPDFFDKACAEKLSIDLAVVKKVNRYYWKKGIKSNLASAKYRAIFIKNFGTITVSRYKLNEEIKELIAKIRNTRKSTKLKPESIEKALIFYYQNLRELLKRRNEIALEMLKNYE